MALLGQDGRLLLKREPPDPVAVPASASVKGTNSITVINQGLWSGDEVNLYSPFGIAVDPTFVPDGVAMYADGTLDVGTNRDHIADDNDTFYANDADDFYLQGNLITCFRAFIHRDKLDRISFYPDRRLALNGRPEQRLPWLNLDYRYVVISTKASFSPEEIVKEPGLDPSLITELVELPQACTNTTPFVPVEGLPWRAQCLLREWTLELDAPSVDTTCVGAKFGNAVKSLVSGGGSCNFMVERQYEEEGQDSEMLLRLLLLTEKGAKAEAQFYMVKDRGADGCGDLLPGDLYYEADILITNIALNLRIDEAIVGTAQWVTTGEISLKMGA